MALIGGDNRRRGRPDPLRGSHAVALLTALLAGHAACAAAQSVKRFEARLADGQRLEGERLTDWLQGPAQPRLDEAPLLDPERPLRWLRDRRRSLAGEPDAFVETLTGDRLPGTVRGFAAAAEVFDAMKDTAYLINTCRGQVVDEAALIDALKRKKVAGAGLDVLEQEPPDSRNPLLSMPNVIVTPHSSYLSEEARMENKLRSVKAITDAIDGRIPEDVVNTHVLDRG